MLRTSLWVLLALVLVVVALGAGAVAVVLSRPDLLKPSLERLASAQLGREVRITGPLTIQPGLVTTVELDGLTIAAPDWAQAHNLAEIARLRVGIDLGDYVRTREIHLTEVTLDRPVLALERDATGRTSWPTSDGRKQPAEKPAPGAPPPRIDGFTLTDGRIGYHDAQAKVGLDATLATGQAGGQPRLKLAGQGEVASAPMQLAVEVGSPILLAQAGTPYPISGRLDVADSHAAIDGQIADPGALAGVDVRLSVDSPDPRPLLALAGRKVEEPLPPLSLKVRLERPDQAYRLAELALQWGESSLAGELTFDPAAAPRPKLTGELTAPLLDLRPLWPALVATSDQTQTPKEAGSQSPLAALAPYDAEVKLGTGEIRLPQATIASTAATLTLADQRLTVEPLQISLPEGSIGGRVQTGPVSEPLAASLALDAKGVALGPVLVDNPGYRGRIDATFQGSAPLTSLAAMLTQGQAELTAQATGLRTPQAELGDWQATAKLADGSLRLAPFAAKLPQGNVAGQITAGPFDQDFVADVALDVSGVDLAKIARNDQVAGLVTAKVQGNLRGASAGEILTHSRIKATGTAERLRLPQLADRLPRVDLVALIDPGAKLPLSVTLEGKAGGTPLKVTMVGGSAEAMARNKGDLPLSLEAQLGDNHARAHGSLWLPLSEDRYTANLLLEGQDPEPVLNLLKLPKLELPPYRIGADLSAQGKAFRIANFTGKLGDSDLAGDVTLDLAGERPKLAGKLHSKRLDADDLGGLIGAQPATATGETASPRQKQVAAQAEAKPTVIPDERLNTDRWRNIDADLEIAADRVEVGKLPLDGFSGRVRAENGLVRLDPLVLKVGDGDVTGKVTADGRQEQVKTSVDLALHRVSVARLMQRLDVDMGSFGTLSGQARGDAGAFGSGISVKDILAHSNGEVTLAMEGGEVNRTIVAGLGFDLLRLFGSILGATPEKVKLNCTLADLALANGVVQTRALVINTPIADLGGTGTVDLGSERIDLSLRARPVETPLPTDLTGISIGGTLKKPEVEINPVALAARGVAAATLGVLLKPFTTIIGTANGDQGNNACRNVETAGQASSN